MESEVQSRATVPDSSASGTGSRPSAEGSRSPVPRERGPPSSPSFPLHREVAGGARGGGQLSQTLEPVVVLEQEVEVEQVVVAYRGAIGAGLPQLLGQGPDLQGGP